MDLKIGNLLSVKTVENIARAREAINKYFNELIDGRMGNDRLFYRYYPGELKKYDDDEKLSTILDEIRLNAYKQGYLAGVLDLDELLNSEKNR